MEVDPVELARMCFRRTPEDVDDRQRILAALWHLHRRAAAVGLPAGSSFRHGLLGARAGVRSHDFRLVLDQLVVDGLVSRGDRGRLCMTNRGYAVCREDVLDIEQAMRQAA